MRFTDQVVLLTGAARGIGECSARSFAREGATVILTDVDGSLLQQASSATQRDNGKSIGLTLDVTNSQEVNRVVKECVDQFGKIDVLVQSAGIYKDALFLDITEAEWDETLRVNLKGSFLCAQSVAREMVKRKSGKIILLSSIAGERGGSAGHTHYGASKGGILGLCKSMAGELASFGIQVNCVAPGVIATEMTKGLIKTRGDEFLRNIPLGSFGTAQQVADAILFLASKEADYITGFTLDVNGGILMR